MSEAIRIDLIADRTLVFIQSLIFLGQDFTGGTFGMKIRTTPDASGSPIAYLLTVTDDSEGIELRYAGTDTIANQIAAGRLTLDVYNLINPATRTNYLSTDSVILSEIRILIGGPTMSAMPAAPEKGDDVVLAYDLTITPVGTVKAKYAYGDFTVRGTVTQ
jgi:hypothetical protein